MLNVIEYFPWLFRPPTDVKEALARAVVSQFPKLKDLEGQGHVSKIWISVTDLLIFVDWNICVFFSKLYSYQLPN